MEVRMCLRCGDRILHVNGRCLKCLKNDQRYAGKNFKAGRCPICNSWMYVKQTDPNQLDFLRESHPEVNDEEE